MCAFSPRADFVAKTTKDELRCFDDFSQACPRDSESRFAINESTSDLGIKRRFPIVNDRTSPRATTAFAVEMPILQIAANPAMDSRLSRSLISQMYTFEAAGVQEG